VLPDRLGEIVEAPVAGVDQGRLLQPVRPVGTGAARPLSSGSVRGLDSPAVDHEHFVAEGLDQGGRPLGDAGAPSGLRAP
jgi:hypothetical protein